MTASIDLVVSSTSKPKERRLPAEEGIWIFIIADIFLFAVFFNVFAFYRARDLVLFRAGQASLDWHLGLIYTLLLLTSSWFVACALRSVRKGLRRPATAWLSAAVACGLGFSALKLVEYAQKLKVGINLTTNDFYMYYFMFTGLHFLHLLLGMAVLLYLLALLRKTEWSKSDIRLFEGGAAYWHMVDLLWIVLFPLIYLLK